MTHMRQLSNRVRFGQEEDMTSDGMLGVGMLGKSQQGGKVKVNAQKQQLLEALRSSVPCGGLVRNVGRHGRGCRAVAAAHASAAPAACVHAMPHGMQRRRIGA